MKFPCFMMLVLLGCGTIILGQPVYSASAVFSADGQRVYLAGERLSILQLAHPAHFNAMPDSPLLGGEGINRITCTGNGTVFCLNSHHIVAFYPDRQTFTRIYDTPSSDSLDDLTYNPRESLLLATIWTQSENDYGDEPFKALCFKDGDPQPFKVVSRMVGRIESPIFDAQGNLYYTWHGDLWQGGLDLSKREADGSLETATSTTLLQTPPAKLLAWLTGDRIAPIARLKTANYAAWNTGVADIAIASSRIYVTTHAIGHSGVGSLLSMARPKQVERRPDPDLPDDQFDDFVGILASIRKIPCQGIPVCLCASPDGRKIFYMVDRLEEHGHKKDCYLIEDGGEPQKLPVILENP